MGLGGFSTQIRRYDGSWMEVVGVREADGPGMTRDAIEDTLLNATAGYKTFLPGLRDAGSFSFTIAFDRDEYEEMKADFDTDTACNYEIVLPDTDNTTIELEAFITELGLPIDREGLIECPMTLKITGNPTINSGSASATPA